VAKEKRVRQLSLVILVGLLSALVFHGVMGYCLHAGYPQNTFLFRADDRYNDFFNPLRGSYDRDPYNPDRISYIGGYFPFGYFVSFLFSLIRPWWVPFLLFEVGFLAYLGLYVGWQVARDTEPRRGLGRLVTLGTIACIAFLTYPVMFIVDRANFDVVVFVFISLFVLLHQRQQFVMATVVLSLAIAMKGYPAILLTLLLLDRRYKELVLGCVLVVILTFGSLAIFKDGVLIEIQKTLVSFQRASSIAFGSGSLVRFNSSLYPALVFLFDKVRSNVAMSPKFNIAYLVCAAITYLVVVFRMWKWRSPFWQRLLLLIVLMILLPPSSGDYRLVMLYPPLMVFLNNKTALKTDWVFITLFGLLLIPKAYYMLESDINIGLLLNPMLLLLMLAATMLTVNKPSPESPELVEVHG